MLMSSCQRFSKIILPTEVDFYKKNVNVWFQNSADSCFCRPYTLQKSADS